MREACTTVHNSEEKVELLGHLIAELRTKLEEIEQREPVGPGGSVITDLNRWKSFQPKPYNGERSAKEIDNFLFDVENYFQIGQVMSDSSRLAIVVMLLSEDVKVWWRTRLSNVTTWEKFKEELRKAFCPEDVEYAARTNLRELTQTTSIREYVNKYSTLMLDIKDMSEADRVFNFIQGLKSYHKSKVRRQNPKSLSDAITIAERVEDRSDGGAKRKFGATGASEPRQNKFGRSFNGSWNKFPTRPGNAQEGGGFVHKTPRPIACFICKGPHRAAECPTKTALNALQNVKESLDSPVDREVAEGSCPSEKNFLSALKKQLTT